MLRNLPTMVKHKVTSGLHFGCVHLLKNFYGGPFEDKVGFGKPSENPYVTDCLSM